MMFVAVAFAGRAAAQENLPFGPENYEQDWQMFSPFTLDLDNLTNKQWSGYFFNYDKLLWNYTGERTTVGSGNVSETIQFFNGSQTQTITATDGQFAEIIYRVNPQDAAFVDPNNPVPAPYVVHNALRNAGPKAGFALGNRYELGYHDQGHGWTVGVLDGPNNQQTQTYGFVPGVGGALPPFINPDYTGNNDVSPGPNGAAQADANLRAFGFGSVPILFETPPGFLTGFRDYVNNLADAAIGTQVGPIAYVGNYGASTEGVTLPVTVFRIADDVNGNGITAATPITIIGPDGVARTGILHDFGDLVEYNVFFDSVTVHSRAQTDGVELMWTHDLWQQDMMAKNQNNTFTVGWGARFLRLYDEFDVNAAGSILGDSFWDTSFVNNIVGPQVSFQWVNERQRWRIQTDARFMAGYNRANWDQVGLMGQNLIPGAINSLLYARPTALDNGLSVNEFSPVGELRVQASYHVTSAFSLNVGYTGAAIANIKRAAPSVHYSLPDMGYLDSGTQNLLINGVDFGVEFIH
jgi:hypothetical protein